MSEQSSETSEGSVASAQGPRIRVALADDHRILRQFIRERLDASPKLDVVGEAANGDETEALVKETRPDILLLDHDMPGLSGPPLILRLLQQLPSMRVLVLTQHDEVEYLVNTFRSGATGYVSKSLGVESLELAIENVHAGHVHITASFDSRSLADALTPPRPQAQVERYPRERLADLSERERAVLQLVARGMTNNQMAETLKVGVKSVESYRARLSRKLRARGRAELVEWARAFELA